jgi:hypothetical protein
LVFVGIDWAEKHHVVCIVDLEGALISDFRPRPASSLLGKAFGLSWAESDLHPCQVAQKKGSEGAVVQGLWASDRALPSGVLCP